MRLIAPLTCACLFAIAPPASAQLLDSVGGTVSQTVDTLDKTVEQVTQPLPTQLEDPVNDTVDQLRETVDGVTEPVNPQPEEPPAQEPGGGSGGGSGSGSTAQPRAGDGGSTQGGGGGGSSGQSQPGSPGGGGGSGTGSGGGAGAPGDGPSTPVSSADDDAPAGDDSPAATDPAPERAAEDSGGGVTGAIREVVEVVPAPLKAALAVLGALVLILGAGYLLTHRRARWLRRQREKLLDEVGVLQEALLPEVPAQLGPVAASVAYRPADGPGAGGDFYDAFELVGGKVAVLVGDVSGHGRDALARTTLMRYTLRAYLEAGLEPKAALQIAGRTLDNDLDGEFATVVVATFDAADGALTYACAGHPPPLICGPAEHDPVTASSAPPIGVGSTTGQRQTRVAMTERSCAAFFTDGLIEARVAHELLGRQRLVEILAELGCEAGAAELLARVRAEADRAEDDMAACIIRPVQGTAEATWRVEELEVEPTDLPGPGRAFLEACGVAAAEVDEALAAARAAATKSGRALIRVRITEGKPEVEASPVTPESLEASAAAAS